MNCLISAGPTREWIDPVRFLSNPSSGKMGYALARAAVDRGMQVTLVSGPTALKAPAGAEVLYVETAREMREAMSQRFAKADLIIMAAAVSDHRPETRSKRANADDAGSGCKPRYSNGIGKAKKERADSRWFCRGDGEPTSQCPKEIA